MNPIKVLIVCKSVHHQNTARVARAIADVLQARIQAPEEITAEDLKSCDVVGFGSGIYFGMFHQALRQRIAEFPDATGPARLAFVFSTSGLSCLWRLWHGPLNRSLRRKGYDVAAQFHCRGFDTVGPLWLLGGLNRNHPDERDLDHAAAFARNLLDVVRQRLGNPQGPGAN